MSNITSELTGRGNQLGQRQVLRIKEYVVPRSSPTSCWIASSGNNYPTGGQPVTRSRLRLILITVCNLPAT